MTQRALYGKGINVGLRADGTIFIGDTKKKTNVNLDKPVTLSLRAKPAGKNYKLTLEVLDGKKVLAEVTVDDLSAKRLAGSLALVANKASAEKKHGAIWFDDWSVSGAKIKKYSDRTFGPILWAMHTVSRGSLNMTAQMPPIGGG